MVQCANRSLGSNLIGCEGKFRLWPCHMNCYFVVKLFRSWLVLIAMPRWAPTSISHGSWPALPYRQLWLQLPWPMCRRTVSLWIIHGLCSSLTQEHWRQQWIMFTLIHPLKHLWTWVVAKKHRIGTKKQIQRNENRHVCLNTAQNEHLTAFRSRYSVHLKVWFSYDINTSCGTHRKQNTATRKEICFSIQKSPEFAASSTHSSCWPAVIKVMQTEKCAALWTRNQRGNQDVKNGMGIGFTAWALQLLHYAGHHRGNRRDLRVTSKIEVHFCHDLLSI